MWFTLLLGTLVAQALAAPECDDCNGQVSQQWSSGGKASYSSNFKSAFGSSMERFSNMKPRAANQESSDQQFPIGIDSDRPGTWDDEKHFITDDGHGQMSYKQGQVVRDGGITKYASHNYRYSSSDQQPSLPNAQVLNPLEFESELQRIKNSISNFNKNFRFNAASSFDENLGNNLKVQADLIRNQVSNFCNQLDTDSSMYLRAQDMLRQFNENVSRKESMMQQFVNESHKRFTESFSKYNYQSTERPMYHQSSPRYTTPSYTTPYRNVALDDKNRRIMESIRNLQSNVSSFYKTFNRLNTDTVYIQDLSDQTNNINNQIANLQFEAAHDTTILKRLDRLKSQFEGYVAQLRGRIDEILREEKDQEPERPYSPRYDDSDYQRTTPTHHVPSNYGVESRIHHVTESSRVHPASSYNQHYESQSHMEHGSRYQSGRIPSYNQEESQESRYVSQAPVSVNQHHEIKVNVEHESTRGRYSPNRDERPYPIAEGSSTYQSNYDQQSEVPARGEYDSNRRSTPNYGSNHNQNSHSIVHESTRNSQRVVPLSFSAQTESEVRIQQEGTVTRIPVRSHESYPVTSSYDDFTPSVIPLSENKANNLQTSSRHSFSQSINNNSPYVDMTALTSKLQQDLRRLESEMNNFVSQYTMRLTSTNSGSVGAELERMGQTIKGNLKKLCDRTKKYQAAGLHERALDLNRQFEDQFKDFIGRIERYHKEMSSDAELGFISSSGAASHHFDQPMRKPHVTNVEYEKERTIEIEASRGSPHFNGASAYVSGDYGVSNQQVVEPVRSIQSGSFTHKSNSESRSHQSFESSHSSSSAYRSSGSSGCADEYSDQPCINQPKYKRNLQDERNNYEQRASQKYFPETRNRNFAQYSERYPDNQKLLRKYSESRPLDYEPILLKYPSHSENLEQPSDGLKQHNLNIPSSQDSLFRRRNKSSRDQTLVMAHSNYETKDYVKEPYDRQELFNKKINYNENLEKYESDQRAPTQKSKINKNGYRIFKNQDSKEYFNRVNPSSYSNIKYAEHSKTIDEIPRKSNLNLQNIRNRKNERISISDINDQNREKYNERKFVVNEEKSFDEIPSQYNNGPPRKEFTNNHFDDDTGFRRNSGEQRIFQGNKVMRLDDDDEYTQGHRHGYNNKTPLDINSNFENIDKNYRSDYVQLHSRTKNDKELSRSQPISRQDLYPYYDNYEDNIEEKDDDENTRRDYFENDYFPLKSKTKENHFKEFSREVDSSNSYNYPKNIQDELLSERKRDYEFSSRENTDNYDSHNSREKINVEKKFSKESYEEDEIYPPREKIQSSDISERSQETSDPKGRINNYEDIESEGPLTVIPLHSGFEENDDFNKRDSSSKDEDQSPYLSEDREQKYNKDRNEGQELFGEGYNNHYNYPRKDFLHQTKKDYEKSMPKEKETSFLEERNIEPQRYFDVHPDTLDKTTKDYESVQFKKSDDYEYEKKYREWRSQFESENEGNTQSKRFPWNSSSSEELKIPRVDKELSRLREKTDTVVDGDSNMSFHPKSTKNSLYSNDLEDKSFAKKIEEISTTPSPISFWTKLKEKATNSYDKIHDKVKDLLGID